MEELEKIALKYALANAVRYGGKAKVNAVVAKVLGERPDLRPRARDVVEVVKRVVGRINSMSLEEQKSMLEKLAPELLERRAKPEERGLPPLPRAREGKVVTRFAPNPDFALHLGNARPAILSYAYAQKYKGRFILRFEDTDPRTKAPLPNAYDLIREDLKWLGIRWDEEYIQSLRMEIYYEHARRLLERGKAYVCTCPSETVRKLRAEGKRCRCANRPLEAQLELWDKMLEGAFGEGEATLRVLTDISHPNPSVRDWIAFRIIDTDKHPHPLVRAKYVVWPTYNFACAVDDHLMGITHVLRAKEHEVNTVKQSYIYRHFGWEMPVVVHFGKIILEGAVLSKSKMREGLKKGIFTGFDDPRLATLAALRRRGFLPQAIWDLILEVGIRPSSAVVSPKKLYALNRKYLEPKANRYMFVPDPAVLELEGLSREAKAEIPYHPSYPERGRRRISLKVSGGRGEVYIPKSDAETLASGREFRLLGLANFRTVSTRPLKAVFLNVDPEYAKRRKLPILQWCPVDDYVEVTVLRPKGDELEEVQGVGEAYLKELSPGAQIQFFRFGFVKLEAREEDRLTFIYTHD